jgi:catechol 2,3-dioxygenase-like lactoylglutathione lyase family enzyme
MSTIPAIGFVVFYVSDIEASFAYFTEKLGFKPIPEQSGPTFRTLIGGDEKIGYGLNLVSEETPPAGTVELYFKTGDIDELHTSLTANRAGAAPIVQMPFGRIFNVQTPDKHALIMWQEPTK